MQILEFLCKGSDLDADSGGEGVSECSYQQAAASGNSLAKKESILPI